MGRLYLFFVSIIGLILLLLLSLNSTVRGSQLTNFYFPAAASKKSFSRSSSVILSPLHTASATNNIPAKAIAISGTVAYIGADTNLILVDITNPTAPTEITSISLATSGSEIIDLQIQSNYL